MATSPVLVTPYERRVTLVQDAIRKHSKLKDGDAREVAVHVLHALDSIPEKMR